jgi:hypothetical protein
MRARVLLVTGMAACLAVGAGVASAGAASNVTLSVNATSGRHSISPYIYGVNFAAAAPGLTTAFKVPVNRWGGNSTSRYNYLNHTYNTGSDWYFENIVDQPSGTLESFVAANKAKKVASLVTLPMIGWVAKDSPSSHPFLCSFTRTVFATQDSFDPYDSNCGNGTQNNYATNLTADPTTTSTAAGAAWDAAEVKHLEGKFGAAAKGGVALYELDNEPGLWNSTHRDVHPDPLTYDELKAKSVAAASAIKAADSGAKVLGPSDWGWCAYYFSAADNCGQNATDHAAHGNMDLAPWYLQQFAAASKSAGKRLLDYFDEHFYPQASGVSLSSAGNAATQALRLRSTRSLWDPTYTDESWISQTAHPKLMFIRQMRAWVAKYYPGTKTAITEYNFGGLESMNGALAQADVLGIFGREGLDLATLWDGPSPLQPGAFAFKIYLNYDGKGGHFGETSIKATSSNQGLLSVYAAQRTADKALTLMVINKSGHAITTSLGVAGFSAAAKAQPYRYSSASIKAVKKLSTVRVLKGHIALSYPANSITLLVVPKK